MLRYGPMLNNDPIISQLSTWGPYPKYLSLDPWDNLGNWKSIDILTNSDL